MVRAFNKTFRLSGLWVTRYDKASDFYVSSWQRGDSATPMLIVRLILTAAALAILIWSLMVGASPHWMIYLTNWGVLMVTGTMLASTLVSIMASLSKIQPDAEELPWYVSMYWLLTNVNVTIAVLITVLYWVLLFSPANYDEPGMLGLDISTHAMNTFLSLAELIASRTPVSLCHIYQPLGFGLWYAAFSAIYYAAGGVDPNGNPFIYDMLDWRDGRAAGSIVAIAAGGSVVIFLFIWFLALTRDRLSDSIIRTTSQNLPLAPPLTPQSNRMV